MFKRKKNSSPKPSIEEQLAILFSHPSTHGNPGDYERLRLENITRRRNQKEDSPSEAWFFVFMLIGGAIGCWIASLFH